MYDHAQRGRWGLLGPKAWSFKAGVPIVAALALVGASSVQNATTPLTADSGFAAQVAPQFVRIGHAPELPSAVRRIGAVAATSETSFDLILAPRNAKSLDRLVTSVTTPGSAEYRHFLGRGSFATRFGASANTIALVTGELRHLGLTRSSVAADRLDIRVTASVRAIQAALGTQLVQYRLANGATFVANTDAPRLPSAIAPYVNAVFGLDNGPALSTSLAKFAPNDRPAGRDILSDRLGPAPSGSCAVPATASGYTPNQVASAYGFGALYAAGDLGAGATIALVEFSSYVPSDIAAYAQCFGITPSISEIPVDGGPSLAIGGNETEEELDLEILMGLAPSANLLVYEGPSSKAGVSSQEQFSVFQQAINDDRAQVISTSWGGCEANTDSSQVNAENVLFEQAALQGQTIVSAAGDTGSEDCYPPSQTLAVDDPASQPYVTSVGGTTLTLGTTNSEVVWNTTLLRGNPGAGGGGISAHWPMPTYQSAAPSNLNVVSALSKTGRCTSTNGLCREVPDVSANAGQPYSIYCTIFLECLNGWTGLGGTSAAAPTWGALIALADVSPACASAGRIGFANPALYAIAGGANYTSAFTDITSGNNDLTGHNGGMFTAGVGYDLASGLGSPGPNGSLAQQLCQVAPSVTAPDLPQPTISKISPHLARSTGGGLLSLTGTNLGQATSVDFGEVSTTDFTVVSSTKLDVIVPAGIGKVHVVVVTKVGTSLRTRKDLFSYLTRPSVGRILPASGVVGTTVTILGAGFVPVRAVRFGSQPATSFKVISKTRIRAVTPAGRGIVDVTVVGNGGTSRKQASDRFSYK